MSKAWLKKHINDPYVKRAQADNYRSRAAYKLIEIQEKDKFIKHGMRVLELGAAPGGWTQLLSRWTGSSGHVIGVDLLAMEPIPGVDFIQGDMDTEETLNKINDLLAGRPLDLVISDMAPNLSGIGSLDQSRAVYLVESALDLSQRLLREGGGMLVKLFQGEGFDEVVKAMRTQFRSVKIRKPKASRPQSREVYILALGFKT